MTLNVQRRLKSPSKMSHTIRETFSRKQPAEDLSSPLELLLTLLVAHCYPTCGHSASLGNLLGYYLCVSQNVARSGIFHERILGFRNPIEGFQRRPPPRGFVLMPPFCEILWIVFQDARVVEVLYLLRHVWNLYSKGCAKKLLALSNCHQPTPATQAILQ